MTPEEGLLDEALSGSREAMDRLAAIHTPYLQRFIALMGVVDVDDMVQEVLTTAFQTLAAFKRRSKFSSWVIGIALNKCRKWHREHRPRDPRASEEETLRQIDSRDSSRSVLSQIVHKENLDRILFAFDHLPEVFREAFVLRNVEGLDFQEIAAATGTSEGTARVRAHRAKLLLQGELGEAFATLVAKAIKE